ncbi:MAG: ABC transporter substrate-binding protein [Saccharospirillaceae bacterium]|nr:ABC transporter substrate-binding protein [Pseudomonadales bacterium]NRB78914.1 ABC transporter substrate-binding protein [Saccharospirillaceae bacterium]
MKLVSFLRLFSILIIVISTHSYAQTVRIATGEWEPYLSQYSEHFGPYNRIVTEAFNIEGINVEYGFFPWKRALVITLSDQWNGSSLWGYHEERETEYLYSDAIAQQDYMFFHLKSFQFDWNSHDDLSGLSIGANIGYNYHEEFENAEKSGKISVQRLKSEKQIISMLLNSRIQLGLMERAVAKGILMSLNDEQKESITFHPIPQSSDGLFLLLSRNDPNNEVFIKKFNSGLQQLIKAGKVSNYIQDAYNGGYPKLESPWQPTK